MIDRYLSMGADRIACSLEVWDDELGKSITPGKREFTTKARHLDALTYAAERYGPGKAFCNFIIGLEPFETLFRRGICRTSSSFVNMAVMHLADFAVVLSRLKCRGCKAFCGAFHGGREFPHPEHELLRLAAQPLRLRAGIPRSLEEGTADAP